MVELKLEPLEDQLNKDYYVSVRVGEVQKLSRINAGRAYKFPSSAVGERKFGKIEIFKKVGGTSVGIVPDGSDQEVKVELEDSSKVSFKVTLDGVGSDKPAPVKVEDKAASRDVNPKVQAAKAYLDQHNLEMRLSEAMQAVLREKPEDPAAFVAEKLAKSAGAVQKKPKPQAEQATSSSAVTQVVPVAEYVSTNMRGLDDGTMQGLVYDKFPPATGAPAAPAAPAAPKPAAAEDSGQQKAAPTQTRDMDQGDGGDSKEVPVNQRWDCKPSVGTWAAPLRGPKLPRGAAAAS